MVNKNSSENFSDVRNYGKEYYLNRYCEGFETFKKGELSFRLKKAMEYLELKKDEHFLDIGCGRGEIIFNASKRGVNAIGIDFSEEAIKIARKLTQRSKNAEAFVANATNLPFANNTFDKILMEDIIEHLNEDEAILMLKEAKRVLKPRGKVVIHTAPNTYFIKLIYPFAKIFLRIVGKKTVIDDFENSRNIARKVHINEMNPLSFYRLARKSGLNVKIVIEKDILRSGQYLLTRDLIKIPIFRLMARLMSCRPFVFLTSNDMFVIGIKK